MKKNLINKLLQPLKYVYKSIPDYYRYGPIYRKKYNELCSFDETLSRNQVEKLQLEKLQKLIKYCYDNVPYYKELFSKENIIPEDIKNIEDIKRIPYLTKDIIRENAEKLISNKYDKNKISPVVTGGTTGVPLKLYMDKSYDKDNEWAYTTYIWKEIGYNPFKVNKSVILRGNKPEGEFFEYRGRDLILSGYDMSDENIEKYVNLVNKFKPDFFQVYPSFAYEFVKLIKKNNLKIKTKIKAVISASENLYGFQKDLIEEVLNCKVYTFYGHTEHSVLAKQCLKSGNFHFIPQYGYVEIINENNEDAKNGEAGEIICTGFNNYVMPLLRYRTNDIGVYTEEKCECNSNYKSISKIEGRKQEFFVDKNNKKISYIYQDVPLWEIKDKIKAYQYVQDEKGKLVLKIVSSEEISNKEVELVNSVFNKYYSNIELEIKFTDKLERTRSGKFRYLIQNIK